MNEHQQAERLASWLEANDLPPPGLDEDVVEAIYALRPELAPAPRVSVDELLASLNAGPLASEPLWEPPATPANDVAPAQLRWARYLGGGAVGTLAAAAMALLVFGNSPQPERMMEAPAPEAAAAPAAAPTGVPGAPPAQVAAKQAPIPEVEPTPAKDVPPAEDLVADAKPTEAGAEVAEALKAEEALGGALADAKPTQTAEPAATTDAVVMGDAMDDADLGNTATGAEPLTASAPTEAERREAPKKEPIAEAQEEAEGHAEVTAARSGGAGAKSARADAPASPAPAGPSAEQRDEEKAKKPTPSWGAGMEEAAVAEVQAALDKASARARKADYRGAISTLEPFIRAPARAGMYAAARAAEYALSANDPAKAVSLCDRGLRLSAGSTPERAELAALKAKAEAKLQAAP
jgi:hypothetical protein